MFTPDEIDAIAVGVRMRRSPDNELERAAERILSKPKAVFREPARPSLTSPGITERDLRTSFRDIIRKQSWLLTPEATGLSKSKL